jgi:molybdopterin-guanine dinucleotide biosynthesis protein
MEEVPEERSLGQLVAIVRDRVDLILTEGYRGVVGPKIEVSRRALGRNLVSRPEDLVAIVTDHSFDLDVPQFGPDDAARVADLLEARFGLRPRSKQEGVGSEG